MQDYDVQKIDALLRRARHAQELLRRHGLSAELNIDQTTDGERTSVKVTFTLDAVANVVLAEMLVDWLGGHETDGEDDAEPSDTPTNLPVLSTWGNGKAES